MIMNTLYALGELFNNAKMTLMKLICVNNINIVLVRKVRIVQIFQDLKINVIKEKIIVNG